jgi:PhnB protein
MAEYGGQRYPTVCPYLFYEDLPAALDWLGEAFGFIERMRDVQPDGSLGHCEMTFGDAVIMMGSPPNRTSPAHLASVTVGLYVHVDDVDAHYARATAAGAKTQRAPIDAPYGVRSYEVLDLEGHLWWFSQPLS